MRPTLRPRFKVCCIASVAEAQLAIDAGACALGLVSSMPSGRGPIADEQITEIAAHVPPAVVRPADDDAGEVARIWREGWREAHLGQVPDELVAARTPVSFTTRAVENLGRTLVADVHGRVVGFVVWADDEIEQLYLDAGGRGRGVAQSLLRAGEARIAALGYDEAWLAVVAGNTRARSFYARSGWLDRGPFAHHAPGGITVPAHRYTRALTP